MFLSRRGERDRGRRLVVLTILASLLLAATASRSQGFCQTQVIHDYKAPLTNLPPLPSPPVSERLPFAPERVYFRLLGEGPLQLGEGIRGFRLSFSPYEASEPSPTLDWHLTSTLTVIDEQGQALVPAQTTEQDVRKIEPEDSRGGGQVMTKFDIPAGPALYRLEVAIENEKGESLATFGEYFRVLEPSIDFGLSLNKEKVRPGQTIRATLSNPGVAWLRFGLFRGIEYKKGNSWTRPPVEFPPRAVPAIGLGMGPGESKSCWKTEIPENAVPGRYRFTTRVQVGTHWPVPRGEDRTAKAGFTILPPPPKRVFAVASPIPRP